jgi:predicted dehydrogenase
MRLKVGFAGAGYICGVHKNNLVRDERVEIVSTFDTDPDRGDTASFDQMLEKSNAVYITAPNTRHPDLALRAIAAGKHVFCEKPMATTLEDAQRVLEAAQSSGRVFQVGHNRRFAKVYQRVSQLLATAPAHTAHIKMNRGELLDGGRSRHRRLPVRDPHPHVRHDAIPIRRDRLTRRPGRQGQRFFPAAGIRDGHACHFRHLGGRELVLPL